jgi:hypothetical protein
MVIKELMSSFSVKRPENLSRFLEAQFHNNLYLEAANGFPGVGSQALVEGFGSLSQKA